MEKAEIKEGRPWSKFGPFASFEESKKFLEKKFGQIDSLDTKIKHLQDGYFVKTRLTAKAIAEQEQQLAKQKSEKKQKNKLNREK